MPRYRQNHKFTFSCHFLLIYLPYLKSPWACARATLRSHALCQFPVFLAGQGRLGFFTRVALGILSDMWRCTGKPCGAGSPANPNFGLSIPILSVPEKLSVPDLSSLNFTQILIQPRKMFWALISVACQIFTQPPGVGKKDLARGERWKHRKRVSPRNSSGK